MDRDEQKPNHPSHGLMSFRRVSGTTRRLFGSKVGHSHTIAMKVTEANVSHDPLSHADHYCGGKTLIEVELSESQFAELLTTMNVGEGVPVTVRRTEVLGRVEDIPYSCPRAEMESDLHKSLKSIADRVKTLQKEADELLAKPSLKAEERRRLAFLMMKVVQDMESNLPYVSECFYKAVDKTVVAAKAELDVWVGRAMVQSGGRCIDLQPSVPLLES